MRALEAALDAARSGRGSLVLVVGETGAGRTAMLRVLAEAADGFTVAEAGRPPTTPGTDWPWSAVLPQLRPGEFTARAIVELLSHQPTLVVIDDLDAAPAETIDVVAEVGRAMRAAPSLIVAAVRVVGPELAPATRTSIDDLARDATTVGLGPLSRADVVTFPNIAATSIDADEVWQLSGGLPLFVEAIVSAGSVDEVPWQVDAYVRARVDAMSADGRSVAVAAAVAGPRFAVEEVAAVGGWTDEVAAAHLDEVVRVGLVSMVGSQGAFRHEIVRRALLASLAPAESMAAHDRLVRLLDSRHIRSGPAVTVDAGIRVAEHAWASAGLSGAHALRAVEALETATVAAVHAGRYAVAEDLAGRAVDLAGPAPALPLLLLQADAARRAGHLGRSRRMFADVFEAAKTADNAIVMAEAAIGLGGIWVNEERDSNEGRRAFAIWQEAYERLDEGDVVRRARLEARIAAERAYLFHEQAPIEVVVERVRELGDDAALAEVLSIYHHTLLGPGVGRLRRRIAEEMLEAALRGGDHLLVLMALAWRAIDAYLDGAPDADRQLAVLNERLAECPTVSLTFVAQAIDVMRTIRAGRLDDAEQMANAALQVGLDAGDSDALGYYAAQMLAIRRLQERDGELFAMFREVVDSLTIVAGNFGFIAGFAAVAARSGQPVEARRALTKLPADGVRGIPPSSGWLAALAALVETAVALDDDDLCRECYEALVPYAGLPVLASIAVAGFGPVDYYLGKAAYRLGRTDAAAEHLHRAMRQAFELGDAEFERLIREEQERLGGGDALRITVVPEGRRWTVSAGSRSTIVRDIVGVRYLAILAGQPGTEVSAVTLVGDQSDDTPDGAERARVSVRKALLRAVREVEAADRAIGAEVHRQLRTGHTCSLGPVVSGPAATST
jgi:tetratricopeptide (TPR) repeat protein